VLPSPWAQASSRQSRGCRWTAHLHWHADIVRAAANNSILLVEFAIEHKRAHQNRWQALRNGYRERARPIMTTVVVIARRLPTAIGLGQGSEFRKPMAIAVIRDLISSMVLSLVSGVRLFVDGIVRWLASWLGTVDNDAEPRG
jgi:HAE1 family hydrophobic/amphiphilic exporter-1